MLEIERKFLIEGFPEEICAADIYAQFKLELLEELDMQQGYISIEPEVRIHTATDIQSGKSDYRLTIKGNGELTRTEIKTDIDEKFFHEAVELLHVPMIQKVYRSYRMGPWILEVCRVDAGTDNEFYYAEIEFPTEEEAHVFVVPDFFGKEVTTDASYKMKNYWKRTRLYKRDC